MTDKLAMKSWNISNSHSEKTLSSPKTSMLSTLSFSFKVHRHCFLALWMQLLFSSPHLEAITPIFPIDPAVRGLVSCTMSRFFLLFFFNGTATPLLLFGICLYGIHCVE